MAFEIENGVLKKYTGEDGVTEVVIPEGVKSIGSYAFAKCGGVTEIILPESVTSIEKSAFYQCGMSRITIPDSVKSIGECAFYECSNLTEITIPAGITNMDDHMFWSCSSLRRVTIPDSVTNIENHVFYACTSLSEIIIPEGVKEIWHRAFQDCTGLQALTMPAGVTISSTTFDNCTGLKVIRLHPGDPVIPRDYGAVDDLGFCLRKAWEMLRSGDYATRVDLRVKYPLLLLHYLHTKDEALGAYIKKNTAKMMKDAITNDDLPFIQVLTQAGAFITKRSIDKYIQQALDENRQRIHTCLTDYKNGLL